jgi:hypothetical protein
MTVQEVNRTELSPADVAQFRAQGFVRLKGILSPPTVERLREAMTQALNTLHASPSGYDVTAMADALWSDPSSYDTGGSQQHDLSAFASAIHTAGHPRLLDAAPSEALTGRFLVDTSIWRRIPLLADFALHGPLPKIAAQLLGADRVRYYDDQLFVKEAGTADRAAFHQDLPYFNLDGDCGCVVWIPLDTVRKGSGALSYVPGSHSWGLYNANVFMSRAAFPGSEGRNLPDIDGDPDAYGAVQIEVEPGDVIVHHFLTVHGSEGNLGRYNRRAFSLRYCGADIRYLRRPGAPAQPLHRQDLRNGDALDDVLHPVVWPPRGAPI